MGPALVGPSPERGPPSSGKSRLLGPVAQERNSDVIHSATKPEMIAPVRQRSDVRVGLERECINGEGKRGVQDARWVGEGH